MKLKLMPVLVGALAFAITGTPLAVKAEPAAPPQKLAQQQGQQGPAIQLTAQQQQQLAQIRENARVQIDKVLTPQQQQQFRTTMQQRRDVKAAIAAMNLTQQQQAELGRIMQTAKAQAEAVLTPAQKQQIEQFMRQRQQQQQQQPRNR